MTLKNNKGFTLIELLIVMAILGVLAVVVLVAINPVQQLARTRDAGRKSGVAQIGRSLEAYYTSHGGSYVVSGTTWIQDLVDAGEISTVPSAIANTLSPYTCTTEQSGWCYIASGPAAAPTAGLVYAALESDSEISKCDAGTGAWFVWSTVDGRGGLVCTTNHSTEPTFSATGQPWNTVQ
jgi:prepilin-type N-terminal cleavage/methylation domain-containing protein